MVSLPSSRPIDRSFGEPFVLGICGGSCSGKTTLVRHLVDLLQPAPSVLSFDAYYRPLDHLSFEERCRQNFDHPDSLDDELFLEHLAELKAGRSVREPVYDFARHTRAEEVREVEPTTILVVDGILLGAFPSVLQQLDHLVFLDVPEPVRLARRVARDARERGRSEESVRAQFEQSVAPMHREFVQPAAVLADWLVGSDQDLRQVATRLSATATRAIGMADATSS